MPPLPPSSTHVAPPSVLRYGLDPIAYSSPAETPDNEYAPDSFVFADVHVSPRPLECIVT